MPLEPNECQSNRGPKIPFSINNVYKYLNLIHFINYNIQISGLYILNAKNNTIKPKYNQHTGQCKQNVINSATRSEQY